MSKGGDVGRTTGKANKTAKRSSIVIRSAQGKQTFESSRMSGAMRKQVRASFQKASRAG